MRTKKSGVFVALTAALFITAALVTSCGDPIGPLSVPQGKEIPSVPSGGTTVSQPSGGTQTPGGNLDIEPSEKVGYLQLKIVAPESGARTILPTGTPAIAVYKVFTKIGAAAATEYGPFNTTTITDAIEVPTGTYNVEVRAYKTGGTEIVAVGSASGVVVTTDGTMGSDGTTAEAKAITIHEIYDASGEGTFAWNFTFTSANLGAGTATLTITTWPDGDATSVTAADATSADSEDLDSGYYYADVTLTRTGFRTQTYREIVHIANGMTTTWAKTDFAAMSSNVYTITYNTHGGNTIAPTANIAHAAVIAGPANPTRTDYTFDGWYRTYTPAEVGPPPEPESYANLWVFTSKVLSDLTLHAKWELITTGDLNITVTFVLDAEQPTFTLKEDSSTVTSISYSQADLETPGSHVVSITLDDSGNVFDANSVKWLYIKDGDTDNPIVLSNTNTLSINLDANDNFTGLGTYNLIVEAEIGGVGYSSPFTFVMTP